MRRHSRAPVALEAPVGPAQVLVAPAELARAAAHVRAGPARALVDLVAEPAAGLVEAAERDKQQAAWCTDQGWGRTDPNPVRGQATRTYFGRPRSCMRLRTWAATS